MGLTAVERAELKKKAIELITKKKNEFEQEIEDLKKEHFERLNDVANYQKQHFRSDVNPTDTIKDVLQRELEGEPNVNDT
ncbi:hypothetical protein C6P45_004537 [Maudiozyma exigua]|uniref:Uncharacterized protein n=1 Tax=Maudiozyma exigua TaxID=34358 RepID=A0A9P7BBP7_MAUEX|nr:hypothetical protein C6P45_004537 [Kazachstania exigua]